MGRWQATRFYFSSGSRIPTHVEARPALSVHLESGDECVIVEGTAAALVAEDRVARVTAAYNEKYHWNLEPRPRELFEVAPRVVFGWLCDGSGRDGGALFAQTATRWRFAPLPAGAPRVAAGNGAFA